MFEDLVIIGWCSFGTFTRWNFTGESRLLWGRHGMVIVQSHFLLVQVVEKGTKQNGSEEEVCRFM